MPIILTPSGSNIDDLLPELRQRLATLWMNVIDEDLAVTNAYTIYQSQNEAWRSFPVPRIRQIDIDGVETLLVPTTDYAINLINGTVTLVAAVTADDTIRADYSFDVFTDEDLTNLLDQSAREIRVLIHRGLDTTAIPDDYKEAILKRAYTNAFKLLMEPTFNYYSVSLSGRDIDKTMLVSSIEKIIETNEGLLEKEINSLRNFNQTNRFE